MPSLLLTAAVGLVLVYAEFFVPGGILALVGAVALLLSGVNAFTYFSSIWMVVIYWLVLALSVAGVIKLAIQRVAQSEGSVLSSASQEGYAAHEVEEELIGKTARTLTDLRPAGFVMIEGERKCAISHIGYISKGVDVIVTKVEGADLVVKEQ